MSIFENKNVIKEYQKYLKSKQCQGGISFTKSVQNCKQLFDSILDIFPENLKNYAKENLFYTGHSLYQLTYSSANYSASRELELIKDFDIYFKSSQSWEILKEFIIPLSFKSSKFAYSLKRVVQGKTAEIQFIYAFTGTPQEITGSFDFGHCMLWYDPVNEYINVPDILSGRYYKDLVVNQNMRSPFTALQRLSKFLQAGYTIDDKELFKLSLIINAQNCSDPEKLAKEISETTLYLKFEEACRIHKEIHDTSFNNNFLDSLK